MSILIKGMDMPKAGTYLANIDVEEDYAIICIPQLGHFVLAEVPTPHGRLIDEEKLYDEYEDTEQEDLTCSTYEAADWKERFIQEYNFVKEKYERLHAMLNKYEAGTLEFIPNCSLELLKRQQKAMGEYLNVLEIRAEIENIAITK